MQQTHPFRIAVAMSGGVDSSVTATLLKELGHEVFGLTLRLFSGGPSTHLDDARRVASAIGIPHLVLDLSGEFRQRIIDVFVAEYRRGRTPNPCALCNPLIKFGLMLDKARELGADFLATGHYARVEKGADGRCQLLRGGDRQKDQSYFLFALSQEQLARVLFPLGSLAKTEVRTLAARFGLPVAEKSESQDVCFIPDGDYIRFLEEVGQLEPRPGEVVTRDGQVLGRHRGIYRHTVGQRKGLGIAHGHPLYVVGLAADRNEVVVGSRDDLLQEGLRAGAVNWLIPPPDGLLEVSCQIRYRHRPVPCRILAGSGGLADVRFHEPQRGVTPGQAVVFYKDDEVLGGGWIEMAV